MTEKELDLIVFAVNNCNLCRESRPKYENDIGQGPSVSHPKGKACKSEAIWLFLQGSITK